ncbi:hypothetical protein SEA_PUPPER_62 [Gordonia phage Pupper]|uniref:Uncharacterized protein n=1 Tax=Gordonia phage Pupper TaxID=2571249 RepID=A0A4Y6EII6_9CAUD|nr:hypothetical protein KHQ83_gp215 [Gordonia phage Pupper]QDF18548.1 hypothetical protein SEA_PUPPER_62 [Gordonia phage Pupper]
MSTVSYSDVLHHTLTAYNGTELEPIEGFRLMQSDDARHYRRVDARDLRPGDWVVGTSPYPTGRYPVAIFQIIEVTQVLGQGVSLKLTVGHGLRARHRFTVNLTRLSPLHPVWVSTGGQPEPAAIEVAPDERNTN